MAQLSVSFLTATTLIYASGAGITVTANTRPALQYVFGMNFCQNNCSAIFRVRIFLGVGGGVHQPVGELYPTLPNR